MEFLLDKHLRKTIGTMSFIRYIIPIFILLFTSGLSAQTVSLSPEQCGQAIPYGSPIVCTANDSAVEYEFKFFTSEDTAIITSQRNYILAETYYNILHADLAYQTIIRCRFGENWGAYGDTCITKIVIDWFSGMQALYNTNEPITNRTEFNCEENLNDEYTIPVVFHVIVPDGYDGENIVDYLSPDRINEQLDIINKFFAGEMVEEGDDNVIDAKMHFCFAKKDNIGRNLEIEYNGNTYYGITYRSRNEGENISVDETTYLNNLRDIEYEACSYYTLFPRNKYLNIFVFEKMSNPFYYGEAGSIEALGDGARFSYIRLRQDVVGARREMRSFGKDKGYTAVHELGHFFGLKHTFDEEDYEDLGLDYQSDPPYNSNCIETEPNVHNVMNYVNDECKYFFTRGQVCRMRKTIATYSELSALANSSVATECEPTQPNIYSANIVSPVENIICQHRSDIITITADDIDLVKQITINGNPVDLEDSDVEIDEQANTIEIQYTFDALGYYDIEVSCGYENNLTWLTTHRIIETIECETPTDNLEQAQWYYDSYASLDFRDGLARFKTDSDMDANVSESSICDSQGNLLFYTDGRQIWNSQHNLFENSVLESQIKERSTIILKFSEFKYAIISISVNDGRLYGCVVDVTSGLNENATLSWTSLSFGNDLTNLTVLSAVPTRDPNKYWLLATKKIGDTYYRCVAKLAYDSNNSSMTILNADIDSYVLCDSNVLSIKVSPDAQYVLYSTENNGIKFFRFYANSGEMDFLDCNLHVEGAKGCAIEFSQSGKFLYMAGHANGIRDQIIITQYVMEQMQCVCDIQRTEICRWEGLYDENFHAYVNLQRAPDGKIYIGRYSDIYPNSRMIGVILNPEVRDEDNGRSNMCGVRMHAIDYNENRYVNHINFPNLVDVKEIDTCKVDFFVCADWCPGNVPREISNIVNLSNTLHNTWRFYDENNNLIATSSSSYDIDNGRPDSQDYSNINTYEFVTIELSSTECPSVVQTRTIGHRSDVYPQIVGQDSLCKDGQPHSYHVNVPELEPSMRVNWTSPYNEDNDDLHLIYNPNYVIDNHIPLVAEIRDNSTDGCPYIVSKQVGVTEINYVSTPTPYCNENNPGSVEFFINNYQESNTLPPYNFSDIYGNEHSNESTFTIGNLPIGEYSYNITNDYCNYNGTIDIESSLGDINISVVQDCEVDTIKLWKEDNTSLSGYVFTLNSGDYSYEKTTDESVLTLVVSQYSEYSNMVVYPQCSINITETEPDFCSLSIDVSIPSLPKVEIITHCNNDNTAYTTVIIHNVEDINLLDLEIDFVNNDNATIAFDHFDIHGDVYYRISNITCSDLLDVNELYVEYDGCVIYKAPIEGCFIKEIIPEYKPICETGGLTDIALRIIYPTGLMMPDNVFWTWSTASSLEPTTTEHVSENESVTILQNVYAGTYNYAIHFGNCIREGTVEVVEENPTEYTIETTNNGTSTIVCVNIISLPSGISTLIAHDAAGNELINNPIVSGQRYCFNGTSGYQADIITICDTFPINFSVFNINVDLESEACYKSTASISFEISGGTAPYTATFTSGNLTTTQTFSNSGQNVMYAEIMQGAANSLLVESADGHSYYIDLTPIDYLSGFMRLQVPIQDSYIGETLVVPSFQPLPINRNVTFTNCTIYCAYNGYNTIEQTQWTIQPGKTVTFENCTIKSGCPDKMWQGIKVDGDANSAHSIVSQHGKVICRNGTTIEDAIKALESTNGGIIKANGCHFNNNKYDIYYNRYSYSHSLGIGYSITPNIYDCTFTTTRLLNDNSIFPDAHIYMDNVGGVYIGGCTFENTMSYSTAVLPDIGTPYYTDCRGIGIKTNRSYFNTYSANNFKKLYYGVYVNGFYSSSVKVLNSTFTDNYRGIYVNYNPGCKIKGNSVSVYRGTVAMLNPDNDVDFGAYIESCSAFTFEENTISNATTGLYVYNSGSSANTVKYNTFIGQPIPFAFQPIEPTRPGTYNAIIVSGVNSNYVNGSPNNTGDIGLEILCNKFQRNTNDIGVKDGYMCRYQGSSTDPTGNQFLATDISTRGHYQFRTKFTNAGNSTYNVYQYDYYQHDDNATENINNYVRELHTGHYNNSTVIPHTNDEQGFEDSYCQCNNGGGIDPPIPPVPDTLIIRIMSSMQQLGSTLAAEESELESKIDGGNTTNALTKVSSISSVLKPQINELSYNGYLSDTVCNALVDKIDENPTFVTSVFVENSPLPNETFEKVQDAEISNILKTVLSYYQSGENARIADERIIGNIKQEISHNENLLYSKAMNDSLVDTDYNTILDYFTLKNDLDSKIKSCNILISMGNYDLARQMVPDIRSFGTTEALNFAEVIDMYISTMDTSMTKNMLKQKFNQLNDLIADNSPTYSGLAKTLYEYAFDTILPKYTPLFEDELQSKTAMDENISEIYPYAIYPNPTSDFINIELASNILNDEIIEFLKHYGFENIDDCATIEVNIYDVNSRLIRTGEYKYDALISIDVSKYISGTYLVQIKSCYNNLIQTKIVKL
ncbi:MAG: right-handed parallel beta-helix repeat-containing protein [Bacteroidales bacterium]|nr:right-handed parallel beta-helix repeat-containing protein [Bacteroidales bacterium]